MEEEDDTHEVIRLPTDAPIDFSVKSHLADGTFTFEGTIEQSIKNFYSLRSNDDAVEVASKIHAGKDFLCVHSWFFDSMLHSGFAESAQEEILLQQVTYEDFHELLRALYYMDCEVRDEYIESLLELGDRYGIKMIVDRVEDRLLTSDFCSPAEKLLLASQYRLIRLEMKCFETLNSSQRYSFLRHMSEKRKAMNTVEAVKKSLEFEYISTDTEKAFNQLFDKEEWLKKGSKRFIICDLTKDQEAPPPIIECVQLIEDTELKRDAIVYDELHYTYEYKSYGSTYYSNQHLPLAIGGIIWKLGADVDSYVEADYECIYAEKPQLSFSLIANGDLPSGIDWNAEGILEIVIEPSVCPMVKKQYTFTLDNMIRKASTGVVAKVNRKHEYKYQTVRVTARIYLMKLGGVRDIPRFDFTSPSPLGDATLVVGGRRIYANKQYLSIVSSVFREMFDEDPEGEKEEYELEGIEYPEAFIELLNVIYPSCKKVTEDSVDSLLKLGNQFNIACVIERGEQFLIESRHLSTAEKLRLADKYSLWRLQDLCHPTHAKTKKKKKK